MDSSELCARPAAWGSRTSARSLGLPGARARVPERARAARLRGLLPGNKKIDPKTCHAHPHLSSTRHFLGPWSPDQHRLQIAAGGAGAAGGELFGF